MGQTFTTILSYVWSVSEDTSKDLAPLIDLLNIRDGITASNAFRYDREATIKILRYFRQKRMLKEYKACVKGILKKAGCPCSSDLLNFCVSPRNHKDLLLLFGTRLEMVMIKKYCTQLKMDELILNSGGGKFCCLQPSMAAKYAPTEKCHYDKRYDAVNKFCKVLGFTKSRYRKFITKLRKSLDLVETKMSSGRWEEIDVSDVPFLARKRYKKAFKRHGVSRKVKFKRSIPTMLGLIKKLDPYTPGNKNVQYDISGRLPGGPFMFRLGKFFEEYLKAKGSHSENLIFVFGGDNLYERFVEDNFKDVPDINIVYWYPSDKDKITFVSDTRSGNHYIEGVDNTLIGYFLEAEEISSSGYVKYLSER